MNRIAHRSEVGRRYSRKSQKKTIMASENEEAIPHIFDRKYQRTYLYQTMSLLSRSYQLDVEEGEIGAMSGLGMQVLAPCSGGKEAWRLQQGLCHLPSDSTSLLPPSYLRRPFHYTAHRGFLPTIATTLSTVRHHAQFVSGSPCRAINTSDIISPNSSLNSAFHFAGPSTPAFLFEASRAAKQWVPHNPSRCKTGCSPIRSKIREQKACRALIQEEGCEG